MSAVSEEECRRFKEYEDQLQTASTRAFYLPQTDYHLLIDSQVSLGEQFDHVLYYISKCQGCLVQMDYYKKLQIDLWMSQMLVFLSEYTCAKTVYPPELSRYLDEDTIVHPNSLYRTADAYLSGRTIWRFKILCSASVPHVPVHDRFRLYPFGQNAACRRNAEAVGSECQRDRRVFGIFQCILFFTLIQKILFRESFQICITRIMREVLV